MIRKLLCWLGWHEWYYPCINCQGLCGKCKFDELELTDKVCWHCGKIKRFDDTQNNLRITDE